MYSWTLDSVGDWRRTIRLPVDGVETTEVRQHNKLHQITKAGDTDLTYDSNGNMLDDGTLTFAYDALNRVKTVTKKTGSVLLATYTYDAMGRRIRKVVSNGGLSGQITNGTTDYLYDGNQCVEERDASNAPTRQYVWGLYIDELLQLRVISGENSTDYYPLQDLLYRTTALTDSSGNIVETYDIDAYGRTLIFNAAGTDGNWFTDDDVTTYEPKCEIIFAGYRCDPESGLYYVRNRTYNLLLGRWLQRDPIEYQSGVNLYEYVQSRPSALQDSFGVAPNTCESVVEVAGGGFRWLDDWTLIAIVPGSTAAFGSSATESAFPVRVYVRRYVELWKCCDSNNCCFYSWGNIALAVGRVEVRGPTETYLATSAKIPLVIPLGYSQAIPIASLTLLKKWVQGENPTAQSNATPTDITWVDRNKLVPTGHEKVEHVNCLNNSTEVPEPPTVQPVRRGRVYRPGTTDL